MRLQRKAIGPLSIWLPSNHCASRSHFAKSKALPSERNTAGPPVAFVSYAVGGAGISRNCENGNIGGSASPENAGPARTDSKQSPKAQNTGRQSRGLIGNALRINAFHLLPCSKLCRGRKFPNGTIAATEFLPLVATGAATRDFMVVSLHDVAPSNQQIANTIISELARRGVSVCSLLVALQLSSSGAVHQKPTICVLATRPGSGRSRNRDSRLFSRTPSAREGKFARQVPDKILHGTGRRVLRLRLRRSLVSHYEGARRIRASGLKSRGFVAPAWLLGKEAERAARDAGMEYTTRLHKVCDLGAAMSSPPDRLFTAFDRNWRRGISRICNATLFRYLEGKPLLRISIHPPDYSHPTIWRQVTRMIERAIESRTATTYQEWIAQQRLRRGI